MFGLDGLRAFSSDIDQPGLSLAAAETAAAMKKFDFVFLEEKQNTVIILADDFFLAGEHLLNIHRKAFDRNAVLGELVSRMVKVF